MRVLTMIDGIGASFNPRAREGRDAVQAQLVGLMVGFNPRAREGRDNAVFADDCAFDVSIHAPARGATGEVRKNANDSTFQSTRPRGARHPQAASSLFFMVFQSTRPRGARPRIRPG